MHIMFLIIGLIYIYIYIRYDVFFSNEYFLAYCSKLKGHFHKEVWEFLLLRSGCFG